MASDIFPVILSPHRISSFLFNMCLHFSPHLVHLLSSPLGVHPSRRHFFKGTGGTFGFASNRFSRILFVGVLGITKTGKEMIVIYCDKWGWVCGTVWSVLNRTTVTQKEQRTNDEPQHSLTCMMFLPHSFHHPMGGVFLNWCTSRVA